MYNVVALVINVLNVWAACYLWFGHPWLSGLVALGGVSRGIVCLATLVKGL